MHKASDICKYIESSTFWSSGKINPAKLKRVLFSECDIPLESIPDELFDILFNWYCQMGPNATTEKLVKYLQDLNYKEFLGKS